MNFRNRSTSRALPAPRPEPTFKAPTRPAPAQASPDDVTPAMRASVRAGRLPGRLLSPTEKIVGAARFLTLPPDEMLRALRPDLVDLAAQWRAAHAAAGRAVADVDAATAPTGAAWKAAVAQDTQAVRDRNYDSTDSAVVAVMSSGPRLAAAAIAANALSDLRLDELLDALTDPALFAAADQADDEWAESAATRARHAAPRRDVVTLATIDRELSEIYSPGRDLLTFLKNPAAGFKRVPHGAPERVARELYNLIHEHDLAKLMGERHRLYGTAAYESFMDMSLARDLAETEQRATR